MKRKTIHEALLQASSFLEENGTQESRSIAELLIRHLLGWDRTTLFLQWNDLLPEAKCAEWQQMLLRKAAGEPAQYITGEQEFYGLPILVSPAVLIPRPETEILVEKIIAAGRRLWPELSAKKRSKERPNESSESEGTNKLGSKMKSDDANELESTRESVDFHKAAGGSKESLQFPLLADIGTGSGCMAITCAVHCPTWQIAASDSSGSALERAQMNAIHNNVEDRIRWYQGDLLEPFILEKIKIDILVSNPPYIETAVIDTLQQEVRSYEPMSALDGGEDGLYFYRKIIKQLAELPAYPRLIGFEVGQGQAQQVVEMLHRCRQWDQIQIITDLAGIERHVLGSK